MLAKLKSVLAKLKPFRHQILCLVGFLAVYLICFRLIEENVVPKYIMHCKLDDLIPFCKWAVIPYMLWFLWVPFVVLLVLFKQPEQFDRLYWSMVLGCGSALLIYILLPNGLFLRHAVEGNDILSRAVKMIYRSDTTTNVCPSLHVFQSVVVLLALLRSDRLKRLRVPAVIATILICTSTVLLNQHSVIDIGAALLLNLAVDTVVDFYARRQQALQRARATR